MPPSRYETIIASIARSLDLDSVGNLIEWPSSQPVTDDLLAKMKDRLAADSEGDIKEEFSTKTCEEFKNDISTAILELDSGEKDGKSSAGGMLIRDHTLSKFERELLSRFRWASDSNNGKVLLYKIRNDAEVYCRLDYKWAKKLRDSKVGVQLSALADIYPDVESQKKNCYQTMSDRFLKICAKLRKRGMINYDNIAGVELKFEENDDGEKICTATIPLFSDWLCIALEYLYTCSDFEIRMPIPLSTDKSTPCFCYFDLDLVKPMDTPNFDAWAKILSEDDKSMLLAWLWGLIDTKNNSRAALWLYDPVGGSGKSQLVWAIEEFLLRGATSGSSVVRSISKAVVGSDRFGLAGVYGARMLVYGDCRNPRLIESESVHSILGNDLMTIEGKFCDSFCARLNAKLMVCANIAPDINVSFYNELSRVIVITVNPIPESTLKKICKLNSKGEIERYSNGDPKFLGGRLADDLSSEMPGIFYKARLQYARLCPRGSEYIIPESTREEMLSVLGSVEQIAYEQFFAKRFTVADEDAEIRISDLYTVFCSDVSKNPLEFGAFKRYLKTKGIPEVRSKKLKGRPRVIQGYNLKPLFL